MLLAKAVELFKSHMLKMDRSRETVKSYSIELRLFSEFISDRYNGPVYLEEIDSADLEDYMQAPGKADRSPASKNHSIYILRSFYKFCVKKGYTERNICDKIDSIPERQKERVFLSAAEIDALETEIRSPVARLVIRTLSYTGMRISECLNLAVNDIDFQNGVITVRNTKNRKDRQIPLHRDLGHLLEEYLAGWRRRKASPYVFTTVRTDRVSPDFINRKLREAVEALGWDKKVTCHTLRHSFASMLVAKNVNIVNVQKLLGHSDLSTTSIYTHTDLHELKNAISMI